MGVAESTLDRQRRNSALVAVADCVGWVTAIAAVSALAEGYSARRCVWIALLGATAQLMLGWFAHLYRGRFRHSRFEEFLALSLTLATTTVIVLAVDAALTRGHSLDAQLVLVGAVAGWLALSHRAARVIQRRAHSQAVVATRQPVLVVGAGEGGYRAIGAMLYSDISPYRPVALLDDDPGKANVRISKIRVCGTSAQMAAVARQYGATAVVLALPSANSETLQRLHSIAADAGLETLVLPPVQRLVGAGTTAEITRYTDEEVLRRKIVDIDVEAVRDVVADRCVLVTGAGGSIGSELARQLAELQPSRLVLVDHDDSLLHAAEHSIAEDRRAGCEFLLGDIRDISRLHQIFEQHRPEVVFHAAALKHVPALEAAIGEGWKTNVLGTANVLDAAQAVGVRRFVNISTDKAAEPLSVLGLTKRIAERITSAAAGDSGSDFVSVRFGNVIGSRGSVLETFERQIAAGGPVTVTHPDINRYFMSVREAVRLTLQAAAIGSGGEVMVLDMGTPVRIVDVARQLIEQRGGGIEIVFTGLRPGEKMSEVLLGPGEVARRDRHPMIDHVNVPELDLSAAYLAAYEHDRTSGLHTPSTATELRLIAEYERPTHQVQHQAQLNAEARLTDRSTR